MNSQEIIKNLKQISSQFEKEEITEIIELASKTVMNKNPFLDEQELAEESLNNIIAMISSFDRELVKKAKSKIMELIP